MANCSCCGQPLTEFNFNNHRVRMCTYWQCRLNHKHIVVHEKKISPSRQAWLVKRRERRMARYRLARSYGLGSRIALKLRDQTTVDIEELARSKN